MSALDLRPGARRPRRSPSMVRAHARMETRLLLRNGEQLLLAAGHPAPAAGRRRRVAAASLDLGSGRRIDVLTPGVLALAVMSTAFTSLAIATGFERRYGVLKRLGATPLPRSGLLLGKVLSLVVVIALQLVADRRGRPRRSAGSPAAGVGGAGGLGPADRRWASRRSPALGLLMAGTLRAEATLAAANLVYVLLLVGGAVVVPLSSYPRRCATS